MQEKYKQAVDVYLEALEFSPENPEILTTVGAWATASIRLFLPSPRELFEGALHSMTSLRRPWSTRATD